MNFVKFLVTPFFHRTPLVGVSQFQQGMLLYISPISKNLCNVLKAHLEIGLDHRDTIEIVGKVDFAIINKITFVIFSLMFFSTAQNEFDHT